MPLAPIRKTLAQITDSFVIIVMSVVMATKASVAEARHNL